MMALMIILLVIAYLMVIPAACALLGYLNKRFDWPFDEEIFPAWGIIWPAPLVVLTVMALASYPVKGGFWLYEMFADGLDKRLEKKKASPRKVLES